MASTVICRVEDWQMHFDWISRPALSFPSTAFAVHERGAPWVRVHSARISREALALSANEFWVLFGKWDLPYFPPAFELLDRRRYRDGSRTAKPNGTRATCLVASLREAERDLLRASLPPRMTAIARWSTTTGQVPPQRRRRPSVRGR